MFQPPFCYLATLACLFWANSLVMAQDRISALADNVWSMEAAKPLLTKYCVKCHNSEKHEGEFDLTQFHSRSKILQQRNHWLRVLNVVREAEMPPANPLPTAAERATLVAWIDSAINDIDWDRHRHAGHVVIPKLTKYEYENTMQDLLGVDLQPGRTLQNDGQGESGFTTDRAALFVSASQLEEYLAAADRALRGAQSLFGKTPPTQYFESEDMLMTETRETPKQLDDDFFGYVINRGQMTLYETLQFPADGHYRFTIRARYSGGHSGVRLRINDIQKADIAVPTDEPTEYSVVVFVTAGTQQMTWNIEIPKREAQQAVSKRLDRRTPASTPTEYAKLPQDAGAIVNQKSVANVPKYALPANASVDVRTAVKRLESALIGVQRPYEWIRLLGEDGDPAEHARFVSYIVDRNRNVDAAVEVLATHLEEDASATRVRLQQYSPTAVAENMQLLQMAQRIVGLNRAAKANEVKKPGSIAIDWVRVDGPVIPPDADARALAWLKDCLQQNSVSDSVGRFARRAFRRPATDDEVARYVRLHDAALAAGSSSDHAIRSTLVAVLVSPNFLFRNEFNLNKRSVPVANPRLNDHQLASRLSYFLWMSMPDERLLQLADSQTLSRPEVLSAEVRRMLADVRSRRMTETFLGEWLEFALLGKSLVPDEKRFPEFDAELNAAMQSETVHMFEHLLQTNGSLLKMLDTDETFLNERLATHYGISGITGNQFQLIKLTDPRRGGLTGMASILTATSASTRTSPVLRGKWILETLLGEHAGEAPADAGALAGDAGTRKGLTLREELAAHRRNPSCASCHDKIDPLGFVLENFDAIGRFRTTENGANIDSASKLLDGTEFDGPLSLKRYLAEHRHQQFVENTVRRMLSFALGRQLQFYDEPAVQKIAQAMHAKNAGAATLVQEIVSCFPFQHQSRLMDGQIMLELSEPNSSNP